MTTLAFFALSVLFAYAAILFSRLSLLDPIPPSPLYTTLLVLASGLSTLFFCLGTISLWKHNVLVFKDNRDLPRAP